MRSQENQNIGSCSHVLKIKFEIDFLEYLSNSKITKGKGRFSRIDAFLYLWRSQNRAVEFGYSFEEDIQTLVKIFSWSKPTVLDFIATLQHFQIVKPFTENSNKKILFEPSWKSHTNLTHAGKYFRPSKVKITSPTLPK